MRDEGQRHKRPSGAEPSDIPLLCTVSGLEYTYR